MDWQLTEIGNLNAVAIYSVILTTCLVTASDIYDTIYVKPVRVPAAERVTDVLHAHQEAQLEMYQTSNMTMEYSKYVEAMV